MGGRVGAGALMRSGEEEKKGKRGESAKKTAVIQNQYQNGIQEQHEILTGHHRDSLGVSLNGTFSRKCSFQLDHTHSSSPWHGRSSSTRLSLGGGSVCFAPARDGDGKCVAFIK